MNGSPCSFHYPYLSVLCEECCPTIVVSVTATDSQGRRVL